MLDDDSTDYEGTNTRKKLKSGEIIEIISSDNEDKNDNDDEEEPVKPPPYVIVLVVIIMIGKCRSFNIIV